MKYNFLNGPIDFNLNEKDKWLRLPKYYYICNSKDIVISELRCVGIDFFTDCRKVYFKHINSMDYYIFKTSCHPAGDSMDLDEGTWAWASNNSPYPNTPTNVKWILSKEKDVALFKKEVVKTVPYTKCYKQEKELKKLGMWRLDLDEHFDVDFGQYYKNIVFYEDDEYVYKCICYSKTYDPYVKNVVSEEWYAVSKREWPGYLAERCPRFKYVVDGFIEPGKISLITGVKESGKSRFIDQLCTCINNDIPFFGMTTTYGKALHIRFDDSEENNYEVNAFYDINPAVKPYVINHPLSPSSSNEYNTVLNTINKYCSNQKDLVLVAIDSVDSFIPTEDDKLDAFFRGLRALATKYQIAVVYSCTSSSYETDAVSLAYKCGSCKHAGYSNSIIGIVPDFDNDESFYIDVQNGTLIQVTYRCSKNKDTYNCFDVEDYDEIVFDYNPDDYYDNYEFEFDSDDDYCENEPSEEYEGLDPEDEKKLDYYPYYY